MAAVSALLLVTALAASFSACFLGVRALFAVAAARKGAGAPGAPGLARLKDRLAGMPLVRGPLDRSRRLREEMLFKQQMPDAVRLLCIALDAGSSLTKALEYAAENTEAPLSDELRKTVWDLQAGQGFDEAMGRLRARTRGSEFSYLAVAMEIQHRCGGSLSGVLQTIAGSLRKSAELAESLKTQTAQGRLSARIVAAMPVLIVLAFSLFTPGYLATFASSPLGAVLLFLALSLEIGGIAWVRKTLDVDLSSHLGGEGA